ncbi:transcriptional regulator [Streptomyces sp. WAC 06725]|uniref:helix-turn-helix domain-containing protein n=1 Tax=Streptomyces sp. WAC 06725 TaxID=2203209 RepID=UPI000F735F95|nr:helix-turn-helix transcriptional regulator [Streptomyces sp. WAC 06725]RSO50100.1 transcriptional regulator [Streptomyces sp. WAC 06725]
MVGSSGTHVPADSLRAFGAVVKVFRERAGLTQEDLAPLVQFSPQTIASIEQGRRFPPDGFVNRAEEALDAFGVLRAATEHLSRQPGLMSWFRYWAILRETAVSLWTYECRAIPGLLQTEAYIRTVITSCPPLQSDEQIQQWVTERRARQSLLYRRPAATISFIIEQALLERQTGGREATIVLIDKLLDCAELPSVTLQIMPLYQPYHAGMGGPLQLLETPAHRWLGYSEGSRNNQLISDPTEVSVMVQRYAKLRSQALPPEQSATLLRRMREALCAPQNSPDAGQSPPAFSPRWTPGGSSCPTQPDAHRR